MTGERERPARWEPAAEVAVMGSQANKAEVSPALVAEPEPAPREPQRCPAACKVIYEYTHWPQAEG